MQPRVVALVVLVGACAPSRARRSPEAVTVASPPSATTSSLPAPPGAVRPPHRDALVESCLSDPWTTVEQSYVPLLLPAGQAERLRSMKEPDCHDPHPELPPGRFGSEPVAPPVCFYAIAGIYFVYRHWTEAARWYRRAAFESEAGDDLGLFGAIRYVETVNVLASRSSPPRPECHALVARDTDALVCRHCRRPDEDDACNELERDRKDARRALNPSDAGAGDLPPPDCGSP